ncbi:hypothetical protein CTAYLR_004880 [Chrysophaeum taylorii]|uniref:Uncharacterized protein n=1 Tax=Chrysophaeum taylorii TaxID=2483200 RepID=A0AAD7UDY3_9STRA|nr:hypothetical protein CTAYLR_004880 [Chrysophaeum taylorii]
MMIVALVATVGASSVAQVSRFTALDAGDRDRLGVSVATFGGTVVAGAHNCTLYLAADSIGRIGAGAVYVFNSTSQVAKLTASDGEAYDYFGWSVAIFEEMIVAGAYGDDDAGEDAGAVYVFNSSSYDEVCKLNASDGGNGDYFGWSVAIYGSTIVVGAPRDDDAGTNAGAVYVFQDCHQVAKLVATDGGSRHRLGESVGISRANIVAGARRATIGSQNEAGAAYVFSATTRAQLAKLTASDDLANNDFGRSVAIFDNTIVVSASDDDNAGSAYIFDATSYLRVAKLVASDAEDFDRFGRAVAIFDGTIVVGAPGDEYRGAAYVFDAATYAQVARLVPSDADDPLFGRVAAIYDDAIVVGATAISGTGPGAAYVFWLLPDPTSVPSFAPQTTAAHPTPAPSTSPTRPGNPLLYEESTACGWSTVLPTPLGNGAHSIVMELSWNDAVYNGEPQWLLHVGKSGTFAHRWLWNGEDSVQIGAWDGEQITTANIVGCTTIATVFDGSLLVLFCNGTAIATTPAPFDITATAVNWRRRSYLQHR